MKQLTRKILALLLCAVLLLGMTACTQTPNEPTEKENEQTPTVSEDQNSENTPAASENESKPAEGNDTISFPLETPETFSMFAIVNGDVALPDCLAWQEVEAQTNVKWDIQSALGVVIEEKKNLLLNSGKYPDVFYKANLTPDQVNKYGAEGVFIALNDLIDQYCPNLKAEMAKRPGAEERITAPDGNIYSLPFLGRSGNGWINSFINQPWLDKLGLEMPTTLDEFYEVLKAFKTQDPNGNGEADEIPFACTQDFLYYFIPNFDIVIDNNCGGCNMALIDGEYQHLYSSERYKEFLAYMRKLYAEGLLDPNTFIQNGEQIHAVGQSGDTIGFFFDLASYLTVGRERDADFVRVPVFADHVLPFSLAVVPGTLAITDKCEHPELVMAWADRFYTQEGGALVFMGVEGESYEVYDDGTWGWITGDYPDITTLRAATCITGGAYDSSVQPELWFENSGDAAEYKFNHDIPSDREYNPNSFSALNFTDEQQSELATILADLDPYIKQYQAQVITGDVDLETSWDSYLETMNQMGLPKLIEIVTTVRNAAD